MTQFIATFFAADWLTHLGRILLLLWGLTELRVIIHQRSKRTGASSVDRGSLWTILVPLFIGCTFAYLGPTLIGGPKLALSLRLAGPVVWALGLALRQWSIRLLGRFFTIDVAVHAEQQIIQDGPYRLLRHPSYTGFGMILIGAGLALGSVYGLLAAVCCPLPGLIWRIQVEEAALRRNFGAAYVDYSRRTWRLVPGLF